MSDQHFIRITVLGSGTSVGVPTIGCSCRVCRSEDPRDRRLRPSILVTYAEGVRIRNVLIDTTPDLRQQALTAGFTTLDAVLYTHAHADHIMGLDDVRPFNYGRRERIPVYATPETLRSLRRVFAYAFEGEAPHPGGVPRLEARTLNGGPVGLFGVSFLPIPLVHGPNTTVGFRFGKAAYLTDHSDIPESSQAQLQNLDVLFLDALRHEPHPMHTTVEQALRWVEKLRPRQAYFTHICHQLPHAETCASLPPNVELAYDGLRMEVAGTDDV
jgi:phosphoribosyl 1,2-cyclic phosphate phosphodiesterase